MALADGSQLYVNEKTSLKVEGDRQIRVAQGEVFVSVAPLETVMKKSTAAAAART